MPACFDRRRFGQKASVFHLDAHTAKLLEGSRIVEVRDSGTLVVEKDGRTTDVCISGYHCGPDAVVVEISATARRPKPRTLAYRL
jgi:hypothetical protein